MKCIETIKNNDMNSWLKLVQEVEPLFGPMINEIGFQEALKEAIKEERAFCIRHESFDLCGAVVISTIKNEIEWFAVTTKDRGKGYGKALLNYAIKKLDKNRPILVQTFDKTVSDGVAARNLYLSVGFKEITQLGLNPAGFPTVLLEKETSIN